VKEMAEGELNKFKKYSNSFWGVHDVRFFIPQSSAKARGITMKVTKGNSNSFFDFMVKTL
jgi:hypothetical protein